MRPLLVFLLSATAWAEGLQSIALPGAGPDGVFMDYLAYDRAHHRVWVPAGNTGRVDVVDTQTNQVTALDGFATAEIERNGRKRRVGPSSATIGDGFVYVGNRADFNVCAIDAQSLKRGGCVKLDSMPDGVVWVASTKEVWVTSPRDNSIVVLDVKSPSAPALKSRFVLEGQPEGYAVDDAHHTFYTNLEDKDRTLAIDIPTRKLRNSWLPACGEDGPKGLAFDHALGLLLVACPDRVRVLDPQGRTLSSIETGAGLDNIDYLEPKHELYAAAAGAARLTVATLDAQGTLHPKRSLPTAKGARNAVVTAEGAAYIADSPEGKLLLAR